MSFSRISTLALALAAGLAAPASATTLTVWNIAFTQNGFGDDGPDWFGSFTTEGGNLSALASFTATIDGTTFNSLNSELGFPIFIDGSTTGGQRAVSGAVANTDFEFQDIPEGLRILVLLGLTEFGSEDPVVNLWGYGSDCSIESCETDEVLGTYTITSANTEPPVIPLPATAALLPLGLVALGALRRRKAKE